MAHRTQKHEENNETDLKEMMTAPPMPSSTHAEIRQKRVQARRALEDAREEANLRREGVGYW